METAPTAHPSAAALLEEFAAMSAEVPAGSRILENVTYETSDNGTPLLSAEFPADHAGDLSAQSVTESIVAQLTTPTPHDQGLDVDTVEYHAGAWSCTAVLTDAKGDTIGHVSVLRWTHPAEAAAAALVTLATGTPTSADDLTRAAGSPRDAWWTLPHSTRKAARLLVDRYGDDWTAKGMVAQFAADTADNFSGKEATTIAVGVADLLDSYNN